jgi:hypothetical protein
MFDPPPSGRGLLAIGFMSDGEPLGGGQDRIEGRLNKIDLR